MSERAATWLACANSNFALARLISRRSEKPAINLRIHYHKLARRSPHVDRLMLTASSSHRTTTRMTDQNGGEEEVRFARLRRRARRKNVVSFVLSSFLSLFSPAPHVRARRSIYGSENWSVYKLRGPRRSKDIRILFFFTANDYKPELSGITGTHLAQKLILDPIVLIVRYRWTNIFSKLI